MAHSNQPNCIRKLRQILDWETIERIRHLGIGEFVVLSPTGVFQLKTMKYEGSNPRRVERVKKRRRKGFLGLDVEEYEEWEEYEDERDDIELDDTEDEDLLLWEEFEDEDEF